MNCNRRRNPNALLFSLCIFLTVSIWVYPQRLRQHFGFRSMLFKTDASPSLRQKKQTLCKHTEAHNHIFQSMECRLSSIILTKIKATISSGQKDYSAAYLFPMPSTFKRMSLYCFVIDIQHLGICIYYPVPGQLILVFGH